MTVVVATLGSPRSRLPRHRRLAGSWQSPWSWGRWACGWLRSWAWRSSRAGSPSSNHLPEAAQAPSPASSRARLLREVGPLVRLSSGDHGGAVLEPEERQRPLRPWPVLPRAAASAQNRHTQGAAAAGPAARLARGAAEQPGPHREARGVQRAIRVGTVEVVRTVIGYERAAGARADAGGDSRRREAEEALAIRVTSAVRPERAGGDEARTAVPLARKWYRSDSPAGRSAESRAGRTAGRAAQGTSPLTQSESRAQRRPVAPPNSWWTRESQRRSPHPGESVSQSKGVSSRYSGWGSDAGCGGVSEER
jgi:hypothetical protein